MLEVTMLHLRRPEAMLAQFGILWGNSNVSVDATRNLLG
jgi:hypothetical protein